MGESVHQGGSPTAAATAWIGSAGLNVVLCNANPNRNVVRIYNGAATGLWLSYGATAAATAGFFVGTGVVYNDADFMGTISAFSNGGPIFVLDIG